MRFEQDPRFTFDTFVEGPGNQMAAAAARRAAESPGTSYNPLFVYGTAGVGKTHLLHAVGGLAQAVRPDLRVFHRHADALVDELSAAMAAGSLEAFRDELLESDLVLLDDVQLLGGKTRTQEELLRLWEEVVWTGAQVVLAADRLPADITGLSDELRARFAGGLAVDIAPPEAETRLGIIRQGAEERGVELAVGVDEVLVRLPLDGARELQGAVDRIARAQAEGKRILPSEVATVVGVAAPPDAGDEFGAFLADITTTVGQLVETDPWRKRLAEAILRYEGEGIRTRRLESALEADSAPDVDSLLAGFAADLARLREVTDALVALDPRAAAASVLSDPDRVADAEALLATTRSAAERAAEEAAPPPLDRWYFNNPEKVAWGWLALDDRLLEELG
ncbi:MAG TPA: DnaA/Hda family protein [Longimicrobiaceae bacterium]|nr:DnaA/Hda family protein [Longimicrobiaceae bacterium]